MESLLPPRPLPAHNLWSEFRRLFPEPSRSARGRDTSSPSAATRAGKDTPGWPLTERWQCPAGRLRPSCEVDLLVRRLLPGPRGHAHYLVHKRIARRSDRFWLRSIRPGYGRPLRSLLSLDSLCPECHSGWKTARVPAMRNPVRPLTSAAESPGTLALCAL